MKEIKLDVDMDFSEAAVEDALLKIHEKYGERPLHTSLMINIFDVDLAVSMMVDDKIFSSIHHIEIVNHFPCGKWRLTDIPKEVYIESQA